MFVARSEKVDGNREELVVNPAGVEGEYSHHQDEVANSINVRQHFPGSLALCHPDGEGEESSSVTDITEHDSEEEGEDWDGIESRVDFTITRHSVGINDFLEGGSEGINLEMCWRLANRLRLSQAHKRRNKGEQQSDFLRRDPDAATHNIAIFFHQVEGLEDHSLSLEDNAIRVKLRAIEFSHPHSFLHELVVIFLRYGQKLLGIGYGILDILDFIEDLIAIGRQLVLGGSETVADFAQFRDHDAPSLYHADKRDSGRIDFFVFTGDVESVQDAVSLRDSEDHLGEFVEISNLNDAGHVDEVDVIKHRAIEIGVN